MTNSHYRVFSHPQRAQSIRLLLEFTGEKYTETMYTCGPAPDFDKSGWLAVKDHLNLDFPNVSDVPAALLMFSCSYLVSFLPSDSCLGYSFGCE